LRRGDTAGDQCVVRRGAAEPVGGKEAALGVSGARFVGGMEAGDGRVPLHSGAETHEPVKPDPMIDAVRWRCAATAECDDGHANTASVDIADHALLRREY